MSNITSVWLSEYYDDGYATGSWWAELPVIKTTAKQITVKYGHKQYVLNRAKLEADGKCYHGSGWSSKTFYLAPDLTMNTYHIWKKSERGYDLDHEAMEKRDAAELAKREADPVWLNERIESAQRNINDLISGRMTTYRPAQAIQGYGDEITRLKALLELAELPEWLKSGATS